MWPFRRSADTDEMARLRLALEDADDSAMAAWQHAGEAVAKLKTIESALTPEGLAAIASDAAQEIADVYARSFDTVRARDSAVWGVVHKALSNAAFGKPAWNTEALARAATEERGDG